MKKYFNYLLLFIFLFVPIYVFAFNNPISGPLSSFIKIDFNKIKELDVLDDAKIISTSTEEYIVKRNNKLEEVSGIKILVVTVPNLDDYNIEDFSNSLYTVWQTSHNEEFNSGVLFVVSLNEGKYVLKVGTELSNILTENKINKFKEEYIDPYFKNDEWNKGIKNGYDAVYSEMVESKDLDIEYTKPVSKNNEKETFVFILYIIFFSSIILVSVMSILYFVFVKNKGNVYKRKTSNKKKRKS